MKLVSLFLIVSSLLCSTFVLLSGHEQTRFVFALPFSVLLISVAFFKVFERYRLSFVFNIVLIQIFVRYLCYPLLISLSSDIDQSIINDYYYYSIMIMILELLGLFIFFHIMPFSNDAFKPIDEILILRDSKLLVFASSIIVLYLYLTGSLYGFAFIWDLGDLAQSYIEDNSLSEVSNHSFLIFNFLKIFILLVTIGAIFESSYIRETKKVFYYMIVICIFSSVIFGLSRFSVVLFILPFVALLRQITTKHHYRWILISSVLFVVFIVLVASVIKFTRYSSDISSFSILDSETLGAYFSGIKNINIGFVAYENVQEYESLSFLLSDTFQNVPVFNRFFSSEYNSNTYFNFEIYRHRNYADQIVPLSVSGMFHFGYAGVFLYSSLFVSMALLFEYYSIKTRSILNKFILIKLAISFSLVFMFNYASFFSTGSKTILFVFIPFLALSFVLRFKLLGVKSKL